MLQALNNIMPKQKVYVMTMQICKSGRIFHEVDENDGGSLSRSVQSHQHDTLEAWDQLKNEEKKIHKEI